VDRLCLYFVLTCPNYRQVINCVSITKDAVITIRAANMYNFRAFCTIFKAIIRLYDSVSQLPFGAFILIDNLSKFYGSEIRFLISFSIPKILLFKAQIMAIYTKISISFQLKSKWKSYIHNSIKY
jgi:hypothetical protein